VTGSATTEFAAPATGTESVVLPIVAPAQFNGIFGHGAAEGATLSCSYTASVNPIGIMDSVSGHLNAIETFSNN
jgi:hypothetical protein